MGCWKRRVNRVSPESVEDAKVEVGAAVPDRPPGVPVDRVKEIFLSARERQEEAWWRQVDLGWRLKTYIVNLYNINACRFLLKKKPWVRIQLWFNWVTGAVAVTLFKDKRADNCGDDGYGCQLILTLTTSVTRNSGCQNDYTAADTGFRVNPNVLLKNTQKHQCLLFNLKIW